MGTSYGYLVEFLVQGLQNTYLMRDKMFVLVNQHLILRWPFKKIQSTLDETIRLMFFSYRHEFEDVYPGLWVFKSWSILDEVRYNRDVRGWSKGEMGASEGKHLKYSFRARLVE